MEVEIYRNLTNKCYSIKHNNRVVAHCQGIQLKNARIRISKSGQDRAVEQGVRNVHAFLVGDIVRIEGLRIRPGYDKSLFDHIEQGVIEHNYGLNEAITYNPFQDKTFVFKKNYEPLDDNNTYTFVCHQYQGVYAEKEFT